MIKNTEKQVLPNRNQAQNRAKPAPSNLFPKKTTQVKVVFLGGLGEIGKNMTIFEFDNEMILLDAGFMFPRVEMLGIDKVIPDFSYLLENKHRLKGIVLSHGHADHIGALRYFIDQINVPVYASSLTIGILKEEMPSYLSKNINFVTIELPSVHMIGKTEVQFLRVNHSIPDGCATVFKTSMGSIIHSGDFKIDLTPIDGKPIDLQRFGEAGKRGVLLYLGDSTNADEDGYTGSESSVGKRLEELIRSGTGRVFVATFSTNLHRVLQVFDIAQRVGRKVLVDGKSIISIIQVANRLGYAKIPKEQMISYLDLDKLPDHAQLILATGTQGEPFSGLTRLANNNHDNLKIKKGDMVIISADPIPGNESYVNKVIDSLLKMGANVIYRQDNVHVSGHGSKEDLRTMMSLIKPNFFIPVHGEYRMMHAHCKVAQDTGVPEKNILIAENGDIITVQANRIFRSGKVPANPVMIDGKTIGDIEPSVIDERRRLSKEGVVNAVIQVDSKARKMMNQPIIETKGLFSSRISSDIFNKISDSIQEVVHKWSSQRGNEKDLEIMLKGCIAGVISAEMHRKPIIFVTVMLNGK